MDINAVKKRKGALGHGGFTLAELLIVIALLGALIVIGTVSASKMQANAQQLKLDRIAENLYSAAQNQLTLRAASVPKPDNELTLGATKIGDGPLYYASLNCYLDGEGAAQLVFPEGSISDDLRDGSWLVEFDPKSYAVYSVFVVQKSDGSKAGANEISGFKSAYPENDALRGNPEQRREAFHSTVGYYCGETPAAVEGKLSGKLGCKLEIENSEKLTAKVAVTLPDNSKLYRGGSNPPQFTISVVVTGKTEVGGEAKESEPIKLDIPGNYITELNAGKEIGPFKFVLDSLDPSDNNGFSARFKDMFASSGILPGDDIIVKATVECTSEQYDIASASAEGQTNSLFADGSSPLGGIGKAFIKNGRHLQNLDSVKPSASFGAVQMEDIDFGGRGFTPIENNKLESYIAAHKSEGEIHSYTISGLNVDTSADAGLFAKFSGNLLAYITLKNCSISGDAAAGCLAGVTEGALAVSNCRVTDGCTVSGGTATGGLIGKVSGDIRITGCELEKCTVESKDASAGGIVGEAASSAASVELEKCSAVNSTFTASKAAGGLVGMSDSAALSIKECSLYMTEVDDGETAAQKDWVRSASTAAGGLVGRAKNVGLEGSFAATVVRGQVYAGGLVGSADSLSAEKCYADCYVGAANGIGGLAGFISSGGSFKTCYSAGFVLNEGLTAASKAAGFTPSSANVNNGYSVFCFDDPLNLTAKDLPEGGTEYVPTPVEGLKKYALTGSGYVANGYYVYSAADEEAGAVKLSGEDMADTAISGFVKGTVRANNYNLTGGLTLTENYIYPTLDGMPHYNDFYAVDSEDESAKVYLCRVSLRGAEPITITESTLPYSKTDLKENKSVKANFYSGVARNEVFVGWLDIDGLAAIKSLSQTQLKSLCDALDKLEITDIKEETRGPRFTLADVKGALSSVLDYTFEDNDQMKINVEGKKLAESDEENPRLYALYREIMPFEVNVRFMSFDLDSFVKTKDDDGKPTELYLDVTPKRYLRGFAIREDICYPVNPLTDENYKTDTREIVKLNELVGKRENAETHSMENTGYTIVDSKWLIEQYGNTLGQELSGFKSVAVFTESELEDADGVVTVESGIYNNSTKTLTVKLDEPRTYVVLCGSGLLDVPVKLVFTDCKVPEGTNTVFGVDSSAEEAYSQITSILKKETTEYEPGNKYEIKWYMKLTPNVVMWSEIPEFEEQGYKLDRNDPEKIKNQLILNDSKHVDAANGIYFENMAPVITYDRVFCELAFNLSGGMFNRYLKTDSGSTVDKKLFDSEVQIEPLENMHFNRAMRELMPVSDSKQSVLTPVNDEAHKYTADKGYLSRPGYKLAGWKFYDAEEYGKKDAEAVEITVDDKGVLTEEYRMPGHNVIAVAQWSEDVEAPIRVEIYIQNVTDNCNAEVGEKTYAFYKSYTLEKDGENLPKPSDYKDLNYNVLLNEIYKKNPKIEPSLGNDDREYLRDPTGKKATDGTILNPQIKLNVVKTTGKEEGTTVPYTLDASCTAVFKLYYDRQKVTFNFKSEYGIEFSRAKKQDFDPGSGAGFNWSTIVRFSWPEHYSDDGYCYYDRDLKWDGPISWHYEYSDPLYFLKDGLIDQYFKDNSSVDLTDRNNYELAIRAGLIDSEHFFAMQVDALSGHYFVPFYDSGDLVAAIAGGYTSRIDDIGLVRNDGSLSGLYEQPLSLAYELAKDDPNDETKWEWPGRGKKDWTAEYYDSVDGDYKSVPNSNPSGFYSSFYYYRWIDSDESAGADTLRFTAEDVNNKVTIKYFVEADDDEKDVVIFDGTRYRAKPEFTWNTSSGSVNLNNKFDGYTVCGYRKNPKDGDGLTSAAAGGDVSNGFLFFGNIKTCEIYFKRNRYSVYFNNIKRTQSSAYLYRQPLTSLPDIDDSYRPASLSDDYHFCGWYTESNGGGKELKVENGRVYAGSGANRTEVKMPSNNLTFFALWATDKVSVHFYSRLPGNGNNMEVVTQEVNLYNQIDSKYFADIYERWADYGYSTAANTINTSDGRSFEFIGWYRTPENSTPGSDSSLTQRFYEYENVTTPGHFVLAAKWNQIAGKAPYNVVCYLLDKDGKTVDTVTLYDYGTATVGVPLNVAAPSTAKHPQLEGYYPIKSYSYVESFRPSENNNVEFYYQEAQSWPYKVKYIAKLTGLAGSAQSTFELVFDEKTLYTSKEEARVQPVDIDGFTLSPENQKQKKIEKDQTGEKTAAFTYIIDMSSIKPATNPSWTQGSSQTPQLLSIKNGVGNKLECKNPGYFIRVFYSVNGSADRYEANNIMQLLCQGNNGGMLEANQTYKINISIELWNSEAKQLIIYSGYTNLKVN